MQPSCYTVSTSFCQILNTNLVYIIIDLIASCFYFLFVLVSNISYYHLNYNIIYLDYKSKWNSCSISIFSPFLPLTARRNPNISHLFQCAINRRVAVSLFWFYSVTSKFSFLASSTHYKPFLTQNRFYSVNTSISE